MNKHIIRTYVRSAYDMQSLRIQQGNRIVAAFKLKLGQAPGKTEEQLEEWAKGLLDDLRAEHTRIADAMPRKVEQFKGQGLITDYAEFSLLNSYSAQLKVEEDHFKEMEKILKQIPIYTHFLEKVRGIGPAMAGVIISELDPYKAEYPSSFAAYAGLDVTTVWEKVDGAGPQVVGNDAFMSWEEVSFNESYTEAWTSNNAHYKMTTQGRSRKEGHLVDREYQPKGWKEGEPMAFKKSITFNPFLKTKLIGVMGASFLKASRVLVDGKNTSTVKRAELAKTYGWSPKDQNNKVKDAQTQRDEVFAMLTSQGHTIVFDNSPYQVQYAQYKNRLKNSPQHREKSDLHQHNMAVRYMVKRFLIDLYKEWRALEGLPVAPSYEEAKLNMIHGHGASDGRYAA